MPVPRKYVLDTSQPPQPMLGVVLQRIRALRDIPEHRVRAGDLGGYLEHEGNLSHQGAAWIADQAAALGHSRVEGDALARDWSLLTDYAVATGRSTLRGYSRVRDHAMLMGSAHMSGLASAEERVVISGTASINGSTALNGDEAYSTDDELPFSLALLRNTDRRYTERLVEAMELDPALHLFMLRAFGAATQAERVAKLLWMLDAPHARLEAVWRAARILGGTFYRSIYQPRAGRALTAHQVAAVHRFWSSCTITNARMVCQIGSQPFTASDRLLYAGVALALLAGRPAQLYQPLVLHERQLEGCLNPLPFQIETVPETYQTLADAEARSAEIVAQRTAQPMPRPRPDPRCRIAETLAHLPLVLDAVPRSEGIRLVVQLDAHPQPRFLDLWAPEDFGSYFDLTDAVAAASQAHLRRLDAALSPHHLQLHLPPPSAALADLLDRAAKANPEEGKTIMKRDMDLIRSILLEIEGDANINGRFIVSDADLRQEGTDAATIQYHLRLLMDAGYIEGHDANKLTGDLARPSSPGLPRREEMPTIQITRMTWEGHDFLESVRDPKVWQKTKGYLNDVGGVGIDVLKDVAKAVVKDQIRQYTGMTLG